MSHLAIYDNSAICGRDNCAVWVNRHVLHSMVYCMLTFGSGIVGCIHNGTQLQHLRKYTNPLIVF